MKSKTLMSFLLLFFALSLIGCSSKPIKKVNAPETQPAETKVYNKVKNQDNVSAEALNLASLEFPYIDQVKHKDFLDSYFKRKNDQSSIMTPENMKSIKSIYFKTLTSFEDAYEAHKKKNCYDRKVDEPFMKSFVKDLKPQYIKENKPRVKEAIIALYIKNENTCKHIKQDLYQHSMLENLTLEIRLVDDMLRFYESYKGDKSSDLVKDIQGLYALKETCNKYFAYILPNELDEFFMHAHFYQLDNKVIKYLEKKFKGKPFDSVSLLSLVKAL